MTMWYVVPNTCHSRKKLWTQAKNQWFPGIEGRGMKR